MQAQSAYLPISELALNQTVPTGPSQAIEVVWIHMYGVDRLKEALDREAIP
jgi:hypothetical protein